MPNMHSLDLLREYLTHFLSEKINIDTNTQIAAKLISVTKDLADASHVRCRGAGTDRHCRVFLRDLEGKTNEDLKKIAKSAVESAFGGNPDVKNIGKRHSGRFDTYQVVDEIEGYVYNIVFSGGLTSGQRGGGYKYEEEFKKLLGITDMKSDTTISDAFVKTASGREVGIEIKKDVGAKFGQPTLQFDYENSIFVVPAASKSAENAKLAADVLNQSTDPRLKSWIVSLKSGWDKLHPEAEMKILGTQIQPSDWKEMTLQSGVKQSGPKIALEPEQVVTYYKKKKAHYLQVGGKGLYSFDDVLQLGVATFVTAADVYIKPEILRSGGNMVIRASISVSDMIKSNMDLSDPQDMLAFKAALLKN
jgi:hypothetical protein